MRGNDGGDRVAVPMEVIHRYNLRRGSTQTVTSRLGRDRAITVAETIAGLLASRRQAEARARGLEAELSQQRERATKAEAATVGLRRMLTLAEGVLRGASDARGEAEAAATQARDEAVRAFARGRAIEARPGRRDRGRRRTAGDTLRAADGAGDTAGESR